MQEVSNRVVTYSLLAHINNHNEGIKDLSDLFIPLVKRVLSQMASEGITKGEHIQEIKQRVDKSYYLDIPYPLLSKIIKKIAHEVELEKGASFIIYQDNAFAINNYTFMEFEDTISTEEANVEKIEELYRTFLEINNLEPDKQEPLVTFIDKNKSQISTYFTKKEISPDEKDFSIQAKFIKSLQTDQRLYNIVCRIYLGSVISSFLEFEPEQSKEKGEKEFLLDTNFIVGLLDLNTIESTHTCRKITEICNRLNYRLSVLDMTLDETRNLLNKSAENLGTTFLPKKLDPDSIYNACDRRNLSRTDLEKIASTLDEFLSNHFSITIVYDTTKFQNLARNSKEYAVYKGVRSTNWSALHDATAIKYIQRKRNQNYRDYFSANCFFVTNTGRDFKPLLDSESVSEIIRAEDLVNILWLTNPNIKINIENEEVVNIGLSRLIGTTLNSQLPSSRIIRELDENIQKYAKDKIDDKDIIRVSNRIADRTLTQLDQLNKLAKESPEEFVNRLIQEAKKDEEKQKKISENIRAKLVDFQNSADEKIKEKEKYLKEQEEVLQKKYEETIKTAKSIFDENFEKVKRHQDEQLLASQKQNYENLNRMKLNYEKQASRSAVICLGGIVIPPVILLGISLLFFTWSQVEPIFYLVTLAYYLFIYFHFAITKKEWTLSNVYLNLKENRLDKLLKKYEFNLEYFTKLEKEINN